MMSRAFAVGLLLSVAQARGEGFGLPPVNDAQLTELAAKLVVAHDVPAVGVAVLDRSGLRAIGVAGVRKVGAPERVTVDDRWHIGSCGKAMTATMVARLVERGVMRWDGPIADCVPGARAAGWGVVPLADVLRHRGGIPSGEVEAGLLPMLRMTRDEVSGRAAVLSQVFAAAPGERGVFVYANLGYVAAAHLAEVRAGKPYRDLMQAEVFAPLGMDSARFGPPGPEGEIQGHYPNALPAMGPFADNPPALGPAGTMRFSLRDWAKFAAMHLGGGPSDFLKPDTLAELHRPWAPPASTRGSGAAEDPGYAAGWGVVRTRGHLTLTHAGSNTFWFAQLLLFPEEGWGLLVACNKGDGKAEKAVTDAAQEMVSLSR